MLAELCNRQLQLFCHFLCVVFNNSLELLDFFLEFLTILRTRSKPPLLATYSATCLTKSTPRLPDIVPVEEEVELPIPFAPKTEMTKLTESSVADETGTSDTLRFRQLIKGDVKQDSLREFVSYTADGDHITLVGAKSDVITLEMTSKASCHVPFPFVISCLESPVNERPLDILLSGINLVDIYENCHVLEAQEFSLEPIYLTVCSTEAPESRLVASQWSPQVLTNGQMLLAVLNTYGAITLLCKPAEHSRWSRLDGLNVATTLRDTLLPETNVSKIQSFKQFKAYIDRAWITMFTWRPAAEPSSGHFLVFGTANGALWTFTLSADARTLLQHRVLATSLSRICYMLAFEDLLLVGDVTGVVHLYRFNNEEESGLSFIRPVWEKADRMGLQKAIITRCTERECYYISICKAANLLIWCVPWQEGSEWLETRIYVGGMKITGLCMLDSSSFAVATATSKLYRMHVAQEDKKLNASMQSIAIDDCEDYQMIGLFSSRQRNLLTVLFQPNKEYAVNIYAISLRNQLTLRVGKIHNEDILTQLADTFQHDTPINQSTDLLAELRLEIFASSKNLQKYADFNRLAAFKFDKDPTELQQHQLQLKYHILTTVLHLRSNLLWLTLHREESQKEMQLLLAMLAMTHMRLRLKYLCSLRELTPFQTEAAQCMFAEAQRLRNLLREDSHEGQNSAHSQDSPEMQDSRDRHCFQEAFVQQMTINFDALQVKLRLGKDVMATPEEEQPKHRCWVSYLELPFSLDRRYCSHCNRTILMDQEKLLELYEPGSTLLCPCCHGSYAVDLVTA
ncbi:uncharacterized protein LOC111077372 [Drosophila obscura]|uniref:uncharacterized protein LOC111077372 n=1 Tax=Drosophila obscura TaxID=7282 RepID=UPI001BB1ECC6|nr:uncharacterized protein LOC111077372 [Drosophila obscura]